MAMYGIERIIEVKERLMDDKKAELENTLLEVEKVGLEIIETERKISNEYKKMDEGILDSNEFYVIKEHTIYLENVKNRLNKRKDELKSKIEKIKFEMLDLLKEMKMLETLRKKAIREQKRLKNRREQKMLDEFSLRIEEKK